MKMNVCVCSETGNESHTPIVKVDTDNSSRFKIKKIKNERQKNSSIKNHSRPLSEL